MSRSAARFADALQEARTVTHKGPRCTVDVILEEMGDQAADLREALGDKALTSATIWRALRSSGFDIGQKTVERHRRGDCACP